MSRIGKMPVALPSGVEVKIDNNLVTVKGPKGELSRQINPLIKVAMLDGTVIVTRETDEKESRSLHGLSRSLINNMVMGVSEGFSKKLQIVGVGYKTEKKGDILVLNIGYSHPVELKDPAGVKTEVTTPTEIIVSGINKEIVGNYAAIIRSKRPPEPYKGKGIKYEGEVIIRKEGKTGAKKK